ncbi:MFS transporter [Paenibacillus sp. HGF5]|uniref:MFS transporter n=1 Tax=Paenibacillus sp. HGF5 TaxID=908341 RepID=UPI00020721A5|nr:MFS transporter [Paenibacillus sp. HGF5]EGG34961.1 transporter, major facilitator family protein [Paenibacillus sp. HGF5]
MPSSIRLLRNGFVRAVFMSNLFSQLGIWIRNVAVLLYVMDMTSGDAFAVSMISVAEYGPIFLFSFIGGVFADRWRPKATIVWCEMLSACSVFLVFLMLESGSWGAVFFATLCSSVLSQFAQPAGMKLFKIHVKDEDASIGMSLLQTLFSIFMVIGPVLGTWVFQQWGALTSLLLTGISFMLSALAMLFVPKDPKAATDTTAPAPSILGDMADGIRYVSFKRDLLRLSLCFLVVGLGVGLISPLAIFLVTERLGMSAQDLPWITIPYGVGEILGGIVTFALASRIAPVRLLMMGLIVNGAGILMLGLSTALWLTMLSQFIIALLQPAIFIGNHTLVMQQTEQAYIGRVTGIRTPLMTGAMLITMGCSGAMKNALSLTYVYGLAGICFLFGFLMILPLLRHRNHSMSGRGEATET